jgi:hypothetical protein
VKKSALRSESARSELKTLRAQQCVIISDSDC